MTSRSLATSRYFQVFGLRLTLIARALPSTMVAITKPGWPDCRYKASQLPVPVAVLGESCGRRTQNLPVPHDSWGPCILVIPKKGSYLLLGGELSNPLSTVPSHALRP